MTRDPIHCLACPHPCTAIFRYSCNNQCTGGIASAGGELHTEVSVAQGRHPSTQHLAVGPGYLQIQRRRGVDRLPRIPGPEVVGAMLQSLAVDLKGGVWVGMAEASASGTLNDW